MSIMFLQKIIKNLWKTQNSGLSISQLRKLSILKSTKLKFLKQESLSFPHIQKLFNLMVKQGFPKPWTQSLIVHIVRSSDKSNPSKYRAIMIIPIKARLYGIILKKNISLWFESCDKRAKGQARLRRYHSTMDHFVILQIIMECHNNKINLLCCFVDFMNYFNIYYRKNFSKRLEEIKVPLS